LLQIYLIYFEYATFFFNFVGDFMRRLKKKLFLGSFGLILGTLTIVRVCYPEVRGAQSVACQDYETGQTGVQDTIKTASENAVVPQMQSQDPIPEPSKGKPSFAETDSFVYHPIKSVQSFQRCFPDLQDVQIVAARQWGVPSIADRKEAEHRKTELVYAGASPYYDIDPRMNRSIPYLVPRASVLLQRIGRSFMDSLCIKGVPMHKIIVSSVLRTEEDVKRLRRHNLNATEQSAHCHGTTFDITYARFSPVTQHETRQDTLKMILAEVLRDFRENKQCYVKYERKQGCFHITVR